MPHSPEAVANELLARAREAGRPMTPLELQKLVYLAHGWTLAVEGEPLVNREPEAWEWGPVFPSLYDALKRYGTGEVTEQVQYGISTSNPTLRGKAAVEDFTPQERRILDRVWKNYGDLRGFQLSALTNDTGTPWSQAYQPGRKQSVENAAIKGQFIGLARAG